jgi:hypothetical protein
MNAVVDVGTYIAHHSQSLTGVYEIPWSPPVNTQAMNAQAPALANAHGSHLSPTPRTLMAKRRAALQLAERYNFEAHIVPAMTYGGAQTTHAESEAWDGFR